MEAMLIAGTLFQAVGQIQAGEAQAQQLKAQSEVSAAQSEAFTAQAQTELASTDASIALDKASAAERTIDRLRQLRQITGDLLTRGVAAGVSISSGSIGTQVSDSQREFAREQGIQDFNLRNDNLATLTAGENRSSNLKSQGAALNTQSNILRAQATNARIGGYMNAAGTLMNYGTSAANRGVFSSPENMAGQSSRFNPARQAPARKPVR